MHHAKLRITSLGRSAPPATRRVALRVAAGALAAPFLPKIAGAAAEISWRIAHPAPATFPLHIRLVEAAGTIAQRSGGRMAVQIFPNGEFGSPIGLMAQARAGVLDAVPLTNQVLATDLNAALLPMVGFAFTDAERLWAAMDGDVGRSLRQQIQDRLGLVALERSWDLGFRQITTSGKPINVAGDMAGLRLRTPPEADFIALFHALKSIPLGLPLSGLDKALRTHALDGQEAMLPLISAMKLYQVQSICALTNHVWDGSWMCISGKSWGRLPADLREIVAAALNESAIHQREDTAASIVTMRQDLQAAGLKFHSVDPASFRAELRAAGYYAAWRSKLGDESWSALEKYSGRLA